MTRTTRAAAVAVAGLLALGAALPPTAAAVVPTTRHPVVSGILTTDGVRTGYPTRQFLDCRGPWSPAAPAGPTVVLVSGLGMDATSWDAVRRTLLSSTRVCVYERPGLGRSPGRPRVRGLDADVHARELTRLLAAAGEYGPFVLVGHSYGGLITRMYATLHPLEVVGMVMVDASDSREWVGGSRFWNEPAAQIDMLNTEREVQGWPHLGSAPLLVMTAGIGRTDRWNAAQRSMTTLSNNVEHVIVTRSGHVIQQWAPAAVTYGISVIESAARKGTRLPRCAAVAGAWARTGSSCA